MNFPAHLVSGGIFSALICKFWGVTNGIVFFCFSFLPDIDHYIYYVVKFRKFGIFSAFKFFNLNKDTPKIALCLLHTIEFIVIFGMVVLTARIPILYAAFSGLILHYSLDIIQGVYYKRMNYRWWSAIDYLYSKTKRHSQLKENRP